jgi:hypothetical protein
MQALASDMPQNDADAASWRHPHCKRSHEVGWGDTITSERVGQVDGATHLVAQALALEAALVQVCELLAAERLP